MVIIAPMPGRGNQVLIVDDERAVRDAYAACLRLDGHAVLVAANGADGLALATKYLPSLVLLDVRLPDRSGIEICREIKNHPAMADVFVVLCSGEAVGEEQKIDGLQTGADEYLVKPFGAQELRERVRTWLRLRDTTAALRASEDHYRRLVEILPDAICLISPQGRFISVNPQAAAMLGYGMAEFLDKNLFDLIPADGSVRANLFVLENKVVRDLECTLLKKDGTPIQIELSATLTVGKDGDTAGLVCVARDITKRKEAEKVLRDSEERFRQLADNIREVFWMTNAAKSKIIYVSPAYEEIWGRSLASLYASAGDWLLAVHAEDRGRIAEAAGTRQISGQYDETYRIIRPDGTIRWIQDRAFPINDDEGKVYRIVGIAEDITDQKMVWDALRENEARKGAIMDAALDAIITIDHAGKIMEANPAARNVFRDGQTQLVGGNMMSLFPPALRGWFAEGLAHHFSGKNGPAAGSRVEMPILRPDKSEFLAEVTTARIKLQGDPTFTIFIRDITRRKQAEEELRLLPQRIIKAQEAERARVARELHDGINQIIAGVKIRLQSVEEALPTTLAGTREILARCDGLLANALEENRRIAHNLRPADLTNLGLATACENFCKEFEARTGLEVKRKISLPGNKRLSEGVELTLFRIVQEAINNVGKYAHAKAVTVDIHKDSRYVYLKITDNGLGFDTRKVPSIRGGGHGLGIMNMRERALALGGTFEISSALMAGTTVTARIPHAAPTGRTDA